MSASGGGRPLEAAWREADMADGVAEDDRFSLSRARQMLLLFGRDPPALRGGNLTTLMLSELFRAAAGLEP